VPGDGLDIVEEPAARSAQPGDPLAAASPVRRAAAALAHERDPQVRLHLIGKLFETRPSVILVSALGAALIGGAAAQRTGDPVMIACVAVAFMATLSLLPMVVSYRGVRDLADAVVRERDFWVASLFMSASVSLLCTRALAITDDTVAHLLTIALVLGAVTTFFRNYFRPKLVLAQLAVLLVPAGVAEAMQSEPIYWLVALGTVGLSYNVTGIMLSLYADAVALLISRGQVVAQSEQLDAALDNMSHGLCMFDAAQRLILCNSRYMEMYGFSPDDVRPGTSLRELVQYSCSVGNHPADQADAIYDYLVRSTRPGMQETFDHRLADGRVILVSHKGLAQGGWVAVHADITKQRESEAQIEFLAKHDLVTGLSNRLLINETLGRVFRRRAKSARAAVLLIDLDRFKDVNDTLGHPVGDEVLRQVARRLKACLAGRDVIARLGGDEFAIVRTGKLAGPGEVSALAEMIVTALQEPFDLADHRFVLGGSIGVAFRTEATPDPSSLLREADLALYAAKNDGRGQYRVFSHDMDRTVQHRRLLETGLRKALSNGEFELLYQPIVDVRNGTVVCYEALLRWHTAERGTLTPDEFIPLAEDVGVIRSIGEWALQEACREAAGWPEPIRVAVNLSPVQFRSAGLTLSVMMALARSGLAPERLELEVTESVLLKGTEATLATIEQLKQLGVRIALDDFGTGYSSLSYLRMFKFDKVKIDRSFVHEMERSLEARAVIEAVITLSRRLEIDSTAEGVETEAQLEMLRREGCDQAQGFLFGRPAAAASLHTARRVA
jgi:diguanylate cyclase (GGDEF)-like protein